MGGIIFVIDGMSTKNYFNYILYKFMKHTLTFAVLAVVVASLVAPQSSFAASRKSATTSTVDKSADWACVATATGVREDAVMASFEAFSAKVTTALKDRKTDLVAANGQTDKDARKTARKSAWSKFKTERKAAVATYKEARKAAYGTFTTTVKTTCKAPTASSEDTEKGISDPVL
jgi:hypothetical protein